MTSTDTHPPVRSEAKLLYIDLLSAFLPQKLSVERVGLELEKYAVDATGRALPVTGERGVQTVMAELEKQFGWRAEREGETIVALRRRGEMVSLEPGGQIELSTAPGITLDAAYASEREHLKELAAVTGDWGIAWCAAGVRTASALDDVEWVPKRRYLIMKDYLASRGDLAHWMMKMTTSLQVSVDYRGEADAARKLAAAARLTPILTALSASSPITNDQPNGFKSYRSHIWSRTDAARCGLPDCFFKPDFKFADYVEYALDVPIFFIERNGELVPGAGTTFRSFMANGLEGHRARIADWTNHLTFLFPEVRLKSYIEIRCCDRLPGTLSFAVAAILKGLLYSPETLDEALAWLSSVTADDARAGLAEAAQLGFKGTLRGRSLADWSKEAVQLGRKGLKRLHAAGRSSESEGRWAEDLERLIVEDRTTVADEMLAAWNEGRSVEDVIRL